MTRWNASAEEEDPMEPVRDMIYQDYWEGYVERQVNQLLNWDDDWIEVKSFEG